MPGTLDNSAKVGKNDGAVDAALQMGFECDSLALGKLIVDILR